MVRCRSILELVGRTPHVKINSLFDDEFTVYVKMEKCNPAGSIKDRIGIGMIEDAEKSGLVGPGSEIIEPTSGNTGIALAMVCAVKRLPLTIVMPESMSLERRQIMAAYGAKIELTPRELGMPGAIARAQHLATLRPGAYMPQQFENESNWRIHAEQTAHEIIEDFPDGLDYFVGGVGTGGHMTGCAMVLKEKWPQMQVVAIEPTSSPVLSGGRAGPHMLQGIGAGFIPGTCHVNLLDRIIKVSEAEAFEYTQRAAREEGIFGGISTGACLAAVEIILRTARPGSTVLTFNYDTGDRYLSVTDLFTADEDAITYVPRE